MKPLVSVVMNCHNSDTYLKEAIDSVLLQTYSNWEIIFWDNRSTDRSADIVKSYNEPRIKYHYSSRFTRLGEARNLALQKAQGEFIAFLDCDDLWMPEKLEKQIPLFNDPEVGLVICDSIYFNQNGDSKRLYSVKKPPRGRAFRELLASYTISMETAVLRKRALNSLTSWFNPIFEVCEEADLFLRIAYSWKIDYVDEPLSKWRKHLASETNLKKESFPREKEIMIDNFRKCIPDFENNYRDELKKIRSEIAKSYAMIDWQNGKGKNARKTIKLFIKEHPKFRRLYFATYVPYSLYDKLLNMRKVVRPL